MSNDSKSSSDSVWIRSARAASFGSAALASALILVSCGGDAGETERASQATVLYSFVDFADYELQVNGEWVPFKRDASSIFSSFLPRQESAESSQIPLVNLVLLSGGPGAGSQFFMMDSAGEFRFDGEHFQNNPIYLSQFANIISVDARNTGFSLAHRLPSNNTDRFPENYNAWVDAAETIEAVLQQFKLHPEAQHLPLIFVGESYGAVRALVAGTLWEQLKDGKLPASNPIATNSIERSVFEIPFRAPLWEASLNERFLSGTERASVCSLWLMQPAFWTEKFSENASSIQLSDKLPALITSTGKTWEPCTDCQTDKATIDDALKQIDRSRYDTDAPFSWLEDLIERAEKLGEQSAFFEKIYGTTWPDFSSFSMLNETQPFVVRGPGQKEKDREAVQSYFGVTTEGYRYFLPYNVDSASLFFQSWSAENVALRYAPLWEELWWQWQRRERALLSFGERDWIVDVDGICPTILEDGFATAAQFQRDALNSQLEVTHQEESLKISAPLFAGGHQLLSDIPEGIISYLQDYVATHCQ